MKVYILQKHFSDELSDICGVYSTATQAKKALERFEMIKSGCEWKCTGCECSECECLEPEWIIRTGPVTTYTVIEWTVQEDNK